MQVSIRPEFSTHVTHVSHKFRFFSFLLFFFPIFIFLYITVAIPETFCPAQSQISHVRSYMYIIWMATPETLCPAQSQVIELNLHIYTFSLHFLTFYHIMPYACIFIILVFHSELQFTFLTSNAYQFIAIHVLI